MTAVEQSLPNEIEHDRIIRHRMKEIERARHREGRADGPLHLIQCGDRVMNEHHSHIYRWNGRVRHRRSEVRDSANGRERDVELRECRAVQRWEELWSVGARDDLREAIAAKRAAGVKQAELPHQ